MSIIVVPFIAVHVSYLCYCVWLRLFQHFPVGVQLIRFFLTRRVFPFFRYVHSMLHSVECLSCSHCFSVYMFCPVIHSRKHLQKLSADLAVVFLFKYRRRWRIIVAVISIFHVTSLLHYFFTDTVYNACCLARYLGMSVICWIRLLNLGIKLWLDTPRGS